MGEGDGERKVVLDVDSNTTTMLVSVSAYYQG